MSGDEAPGWSAIDEALASLYGERTPHHFGTLLSYCLGGPDPLDGISAYQREEPRPHWHFVTYGFSELYDKEWDDPEVSGYGFELTFRLGRRLEEEEPPRWPLHFLQNLARYVFSTGNGFDSGDHMNLNGPIALESDTPIVAIGFVEDPELAFISGPYGKLGFLQVVGLTQEEFLAVKRWNTRGFLGVMARGNALLITDLGRASILLQPDVERLVAEGTRESGSSTGYLFTDALSWEPVPEPGVLVRLGANPAREVSEIVTGRIPYGRNLTVGGDKQVMTLHPAEENKWEADGTRLEIGLSAEQTLALSERFRQGVGEFEIEGLPGVRFEIVVSRIKDSSGNIVGEVR